MKRKRQNSGSRPPKTKAVEPTVSHFTPVEEQFFSAAGSTAEYEPTDSFADLDEGYQPRPGLLRRLFARAA
ncbi:MAG: hypothetical protein JWP01_461 [Myxococcales bacterium]|nr:hypothetical protein [Myxococcales bacterium]